MKLDSKYFDALRSKPGTGKAERKDAPCQWKGCARPGSHKAPMGRGQEGRYFVFCVDHVRQYNASYNYFQGMSDKEVTDFQKDAQTGHRPTWKTGANAWAHGTKDGARSADPETLKSARSNDPNNFFAWRAKRTAGEADPKRYVKPLERKALETMHLDETATKEQIKSRYKDLVKKHHPDANGGDTRSADTLREIIQAYNQLKQSGLV